MKREEGMGKGEEVLDHLCSSSYTETSPHGFYNKVLSTKIRQKILAMSSYASATAWAMSKGRVTRAGRTGPALMTETGTPPKKLHCVHLFVQTRAGTLGRVVEPGVQQTRAHLRHHTPL